MPHTCNTSLQPQTQGLRIKLKEAVRVVKTTPLWTTGRQNSLTVRVRFHTPFSFR